MTDNNVSGGIELRLSEDKKKVEAVVSDAAVVGLSIVSLQEIMSGSEFKNCVFNEPLTKEGIALVQSSSARAFTIADRKSASLHLEVPPDKLTATLAVTTARGGKNPTPKLINAYLKKQGIVEGILQSNINKHCSMFDKLEPGQQIMIDVAKGKAAELGFHSEFTWVATPFQDRELKPQEREDGTTDMYDLGKIETVEPGDTVMIRIPARKNTDGVNVYGEVINSIIPPDKPFVTTEGVAISEEDPHKLIATRKGVAMRQRDVIRVDDILVLNDVDLTTGHIEFDGTVMIKGSVREGLKVQVTGDILVSGLVESAYLEAGGNVSIKQGILGRKVADDDHDESDYGAQVKAGGDIEAKYLQYVAITAEGNISVKDQLLNCLINDCNHLSVGGASKRQAKLVGGKIYVRTSIDVGILGSDSYVPSFIYIGTNVDKLRSEVESIKSELLDKQDALARCNVQLEKFTAKGDQAKIDHFNKVIKKIRGESLEMKDRYEQLSNEYKELVKLIAINIYGEMHPGIQLNYGKFHSTIQDYGKSCQLKFTKMGLKRDKLPR